MTTKPILLVEMLTRSPEPSQVMPKISETRPCTPLEACLVARETLLHFVSSKGGKNLAEEITDVTADLQMKARPGDLSVRLVSPETDTAAVVIEVYAFLKWHKLSFIGGAGTRSRIEDAVGRELGRLREEAEHEAEMREMATRASKELAFAIPVIVDGIAQAREQLQAKKIPVRDVDPTFVALAAAMLAAGGPNRFR